jgi:hypothetical protein
MTDKEERIQERLMRMGIEGKVYSIDQLYTLAEKQLSVEAKRANARSPKENIEKYVKWLEDIVLYGYAFALIKFDELPGYMEVFKISNPNDFEIVKWAENSSIPQVKYKKV